MKSPAYKHAASGAYRARYEAQSNAEVRAPRERDIERVHGDILALEMRRHMLPDDQQRIADGIIARGRAWLARATGGEP